jgi:DNA processing protein
MAVPGRIDSPGSAGCHRLIKDGAALIETIDDVLTALGRVGEGLHDYAERTGRQAREKVEPPLFNTAMINLNEVERALIDHLTDEVIHIDELIVQSRQTAAAVNASLTSLQLKGLVKQLPGNYYRRR